jgi:hypothetical protein
MSSREERAARRSAEWNGEVVPAGCPKGRLYDPLTLEQRLAAFTRLNALAWTAAGAPSLSPIPRSEWPGEVFEIRRRG